MGFVLALTGLISAAFGGWRSYVSARRALAPLLHDGEPTRTAIEAARPLYARTRVRLFARNLVLAIGWLFVALYGLFLLSVGLAAR